MNPELKLSEREEVGRFKWQMRRRSSFERVTVEFKSGVRESKRTHINY